jgi:iron-sulfur cluster repair protein YtfE (RIC family)
MLVTIGKPPAGDDLVDNLLECHGRIRSFVAVAVAAAERRDVAASAVVDGCLRVERYFTEALPLHVLDEEESILPRLRGRSREVDEALATMHAQHAAHEPLLRALLDASAELRRGPQDAHRRAALGVAAQAIGAEFAAHLGLEEAVVFPAIRRLPDATQATIVEELRARRRR